MKRKTRQRILSMFMAILMVVGLLPTDFVGGVTQVKAAQKTYVFAPEAAIASGGSAQEIKSGTNDYFTMMFNAKSLVDACNKTFEGNVVCPYRFNTQGSMSSNTSGGSLKFTTSGSAQVTVYWICGGDGRQLKMINDNNEEKGLTEGETVKNSLYISKMSIDEAGTYYLGSAIDGGMYICRVEVTEGTNGTAVSASVKYDGSEIFTISGGYENADSVSVKASKESVSFDSEPTAEKLSIAAAADDALGGTYSVTVDSANKKLVVKNSESGDTVLAEVPYKISGVATVSGAISSDVNGATLTFTGSKEGTDAVTATVTDGQYSARLEVGDTYNVTISGKDGYRLDPNPTVIDLTENTAGEEITSDLTAVYWNAKKTATVTVGGTTFTLKPGAKEGENFTVEATEGDGSVEFALASEGIVWANLGGKGEGTVGTVSTSDNLNASVKGNKITLTYTDNDLPKSYTLNVKDNSAKGEPNIFGTVYSYNLKNGSIISSLYTNSEATGYNKIANGKTVTSTDKLVSFTGNNAIYYNGAAHGIVMSNDDTFSIKVGGKCTIDLSLCQYAVTGSSFTITGAAEGTLSATSIDAKAATDGATTSIEYTGEATTLTFTCVSSGAVYLHSLGVKYAVQEVKMVEQEVMPSVAGDDADTGKAVVDTDGVPKASKKDSLTVQPIGQTLHLTNTTGALTDKFADAKDVGYYLFPLTDDAENVLEFDVVVTGNTATDNNSVFCAGLFTNNYISTLGLRAGGTKVRGVYSKNVAVDENGNITAGSFNGAGSPTEVAVGLNRKIHYVISQEDGKTLVEISYVDDNGKTQTAKFNQAMAANETVDGKLYYGMALTSVSAEVSNMVYKKVHSEKDSNGNEKVTETVLYDQNACYYPMGTAPKASDVKAVAAESREYIDISWTGEELEYDEKYAVEMQKDGGEWVELSHIVKGNTYRYTLPAGEGGNYKFRVCGQLGEKTLGGSRSEYATMDKAVYVLGALEKPVVNITSSSNSISLTWNAIPSKQYYEVYRYSYDEGASNKKTIATKLTTENYVDKDVKAEVPYYYEVRAFDPANDNKSPLSDVVWAVPTAGHTGDYVYEDEATEIFITKKSFDTVYKDNAVLEGKVLGNGTLKAEVNGKEAASKKINAGDTFAFNLKLAEGRNDVNLLFTDSQGKVTRKTYNFVYLTNYDMVVDSAYEGTDGDANADGIPTYKTVTAAVNAVPANNASNKVILVKAGSYEELLNVNSPYITLIGEDRESTSIHCYPADYMKAQGLTDTSKYEAGGDMTMRCATYIKSTAANFTAENISFANDYDYSTPDGKSNKSADAVRVDADKASFVNVKMSSVQDTLYMNAGHQYYYKCRIEGLVDYIYSGDNARSYFYDSELVFLYQSTKSSGYVCAPKTAANATYGLTFNKCVVTSEEGCNGTGYLLARPWGPDAYVTWINCYMGGAINSLTSYGDMSGNLATNARFFEYGSYGPGYAINTGRRQISPAKAEKMVTDEFLEWSPSTVVSDLSKNHYVGKVVTTSEDKFVTDKYVDDKYLQTDGDDTGLSSFNMEGYSTAYGVTGGGLLKENNENYYKVKNANEFLDALVKSKDSGKNSVIELTADVNLGSNEVENYDSYSSIIKPYTAQALTHPTLIKSGVSILTFSNIYNLTIFSSNGSSIKHANITMKNSENIVIRNIKFDEIWEWDEATSGDYDRNDWDYMTIDQSSTGVWIDHCTFYKAYDGVVDIKNPLTTQDVTISWCEFLPGSEDNIFFNEMMDTLAANPDNYPYYKSLLDKGVTKDQIWWYAYGQKKTHLLGQADDATNASGIRLTLANNYYYNSMDRMPRLRFGNAHVYNCIMDAQELLDARDSIKDEEAAKHIVSNGASSTCGGTILLENCYMNGIMNALNSGNGSSPSGYINAINSRYYMYGELTKLEPKCNSTGDTRVLVTDADEFKSALPYSDYALYNADDLVYILKDNSGAGKRELTNLQWEKTSYNTTHTTHTWDEGTVVKEPTRTEEGIKLYRCKECVEVKTEVIPKLEFPITGITLDKTALTLEKGNSQTLKATVSPEEPTEDATVTWTSSNTNVVTVDKNGKVTAVAVGTATVTAKAGKFTATCKITVKDTESKPSTDDKKPSTDDKKPSTDDNKPSTDDNKPEEIKSGLINDGNGNWFYYVDNKVATDFTGLVENENGWWTVVNGQVDFNYNGLVENENGWWAVVNGQVDFNYNGLVENENGWWMVINGQVDFNYTGVAANENGVWNVKNGSVDFSTAEVTSINGFAFDGTKWCKYVDGKYDTNCNGLVNSSNGNWYYMTNGQQQKDFTGLVNNENGWWMVVNGQVDFRYTGLAQNEIGWWAVVNGQVDFSINGLVQNEIGWWMVSNGQVDFTYNGLVQNENGWWKIANGAVDFGYTGLAQNENGWWMITNGQVDFSYNGQATNEYGTWLVRNGQVVF